MVATVEGADERTSRGTCAGAGVGGGGISPPIAAGLFGSPNFVFLFGGGGSCTFSARAEERVLRPLVPSPRALFWIKMIWSNLPRSGTGRNAERLHRSAHRRNHLLFYSTPRVALAELSLSHSPEEKTTPKRNGKRLRNVQKNFLGYSIRYVP